MGSGIILEKLSIIEGPFTNQHPTLGKSDMERKHSAGRRPVLEAVWNKNTRDVYSTVTT